MLTKLGVTALLGTIGAAMAGGTAKADEPRYEGNARVVIQAPAPIVQPVGWFRGETRWQRAERERREAAFRHAEWLRMHNGFGRGVARGYERSYDHGAGYGYGNDHGAGYGYGYGNDHGAGYGHGNDRRDGNGRR
ncbi:MAG: hypothetical protein JWM53_1390 [bacterium]|nr:hypothetical protein [bacterium]